MKDILERRARLEEERKKRLRQFTPEQRAKQAQQLMDKMDHFGKTYFSNSQKLWDEEGEDNR